MAVVKAVKPLCVLFILGLLWMAETFPGAHSARQLQSAHDIVYGGSDASGSIENRKALEDIPKLLYSCGYPCCGVNYHGPCSRCCPKGVQHTPQPMTDKEEAGSGGGGGHAEGDGHK